jgi:hypothetical protein
MRTLLICLTIATVALFAIQSWRENEQRKADTIARIADAALREAAAREAAQRLAPQLPPSPPMQPESRSLTYVPGLGRYVEHDSRTSAMQNIGGGGGGAPRKKPDDSASDTIKKAWGFGKTALDEKR